LWIAVLGTQIIATLIATYGAFMTPLGWKWALFVWGYALAWFLVNDRVKLPAYRIFDPTKDALLGRNFPFKGGSRQPGAVKAMYGESRAHADPGRCLSETDRPSVDQR
jgi:H+-transporting ATPase